MARPVRIEFPGALYHITARGNKKENIFNRDRDRMVFLKILNETVTRYHFICYAYCLMPNHYHLLIETPNGNLSLGIRELNGVYAQKLNWVYKTVGHVFQGRFKAILVEKESYLLELCRYIVLNPVRAGMVQYPWEWQWSSYQATVGQAENPKFLSTEWILSQFHEEQRIAKKSYEDFVLAGIGKEAPWKDLRGRFILGKDSFVEKIEHYIDKKKTIRELPRAERFVARKKLTEIFNEGKLHPEKESKIFSAHVEHGYTQKEIANYLGVHYSTISKALKRFIEKNTRKD